jgi:hypothetical protein
MYAMIVIFSTWPVSIGDNLPMTPPSISAVTVPGYYSTKEECVAAAKEVPVMVDNFFAHAECFKEAPTH